MLKQSFALLLFLGVTAFIVRSASGCDDAGTEPPIETTAPAPPAPLPQNAARESQRPPIVNPDKPRPTHDAARAKNIVKSRQEPDPRLKPSKEDPAFFSASKAAPTPVFRVEKEDTTTPPAVPAPPTQQAPQAQQAPTP